VLVDLQSASASGVAHGVVQVHSPTVRQSSPHLMAAGSAVAIPTGTGPQSATGPTGAGPSTTGGATAVSSPRKWLAAGGCAVAALIVICLAASAALIAGQLWGGASSQAAAQDLVATQTVVAQTRNALSTVVSAATQTAAVPPPSPTSTPELVIPTSTPPPTSTPDPNRPTPIPPGMPYALIVSITQDGEFYVVNYETLAFVESMSNRHIHFFFDTTSVENAGVPGQGPYLMYAGPRPFREVSVYDVPPDATQICALVANPDHTIIPDSGNCFNLPVIEGGTPTRPVIPPTPKPTKDKDNGGGGYDY
jgi:hypothetical protein